MEKIAVIRKTPNKNEWCVKSKKGKNLGCYNSEKKAKERLRQVEYFKRQGSIEKYRNLSVNQIEGK